MIVKKPLKRRPVYLVTIEYNCGQDVEVYSTLTKAQKALKTYMDGLLKLKNLAEKPAVIRKRFKEVNKMYFFIDVLSEYDTIMYTVHGDITQKQIL